MKDIKKIAVGSVAAVAVVAACFFAFKSLAPADTNAEAQVEARKMIQSRNASQAVPPEQYAQMMKGMVGGKKR